MARVAVVTGGTRGIGAAISRALKGAGYKVAANYGGNDEAAKKFRTETDIGVYKWDVSDYQACANGLKAVEAELGPVDILVNNAGITRDTMFHKMAPEQWSQVIATNLGSLFNMCRPVIEGMRERNFGRIINISSINGQKGQMGQVNYSAAKAGELGFTKALAQENARKGITVLIGEAGVAPKDMFDDIDTTVPGLAKYAGAQPPANLVIALQGIATNVEQARQAAEARGRARGALNRTRATAVRAVPRR